MRLGPYEICLKKKSGVVFFMLLYNTSKIRMEVAKRALLVKKVETSFCENRARKKVLRVNKS